LVHINITIIVIYIAITVVIISVFTISSDRTFSIIRQSIPLLIGF